MTEKAVNDLADLCGHAGMAIAMGNHLFDWPRSAAVGRVFLPKDAFTRHEVSIEAVVSGKTPSGLDLTITDLCTVANEHAFKAKTLLGALKQQNNQHLTSAFLMLAPAGLMIDRRKKAPVKDLDLANWRIYWSIGRMAALG